MFLSLRKVMSGKGLSARSDDGYRAIPRADIWISRPGGVFQERRLTMRCWLKDIAADFALLGLWVPG
jgi:hypothetical protein